MRGWKKGLSLCITMIMLFAGIVVNREILQARIFIENVNNSQAEKPAVGINVAYHTQKEISDYVQTHPADMKDKLTYALDPVLTDDYDMGLLSTETQESALNMLNQIRYIAGISDNVALNNQYIQLAQAASLTNYLNGEMSHYPSKPEGMTDELYALGSQGASKSNISWASWKGRSLNETNIRGWMNDGDARNIDRVGHRRWLLNPCMAETGFGAISGNKGTYSAVYALDNGNTTAAEYGVCWPAQNMPTEYFGSEFPWSVSTGENENEAEVKVTLTNMKTGQTWNFSKAQADGEFYVNNTRCGQIGCIIFRPADKPKYSEGDSYQVSVTGLVKGDISYTVKFFQLYLKEVTIDITNDKGLVYDGKEKKLTYSIYNDTDGFNRITNRKAGEISNFNVTICRNGTKVDSICDAGNYVVTAVYNDGTYYGELKKKVSVSKGKTISIAKTNINSVTNKEYNKKQIKPVVRVTYGKKTLVKNRDYTVSYGANIIGKGYVQITGKGNYSGSVKKYFKIVPRKTSVSIKIRGGKVNVNLIKRKEVTSYQIQYSTNSNFKNSKVVTTKSAKYTLKVKKGMTYYIRARGVKKMGASKYYGGWSKTKKVIKK